jgi:hypothetical protein
MDKRIVIPRIVVRPILPPPLEIGVRIRPQWLHWQVGRYREKLSFGPGGEGRARIWVPEMEGEQHNMILNQLYDTLIAQYDFVGSSVAAAVGTGSAAPDPTQTQLANEVNRASYSRPRDPPSGERHQIEALSGYGEYNIRRVHEFPATAVGGLNLTEWGYSPTSSRNGPLMTRELFRDSNGNPIVLTLDAEQSLRLIYRYKVTVSPTSPQAVSVDIGGEGPGIRTAKFIMTGRARGGQYQLADLPSNGERGGDLLIASTLARGSIWANSGAGTAKVHDIAVPLTYIHSTSSVTGGVRKDLSYTPASGRSRTASILLQTTEGNMTIKSVFLDGSIGTFGNTPTANLVFDDGQEFTKDNLHRLFIGYWQITWGP